MNRLKLIQEIDSDISKFRKSLSGNSNIHIVEEKILDLLGEIEEKIFQILGKKYEKSSLEKEIIFKRFLAMNCIDTQYTSIDDFLDELILKISEDLERRKQILNHDIFISGSMYIDSKGKTKEKIGKMKTAEKNKKLHRVFYDLGINFSQIDQFVEQINENRMRQIPYQIYHINIENQEKTILISNQIGQATFIYDSIIDPEIFISVEKGETINGFQALKIIYNHNTFENNLKIALGNKLNFKEKENRINNEVEERGDRILQKDKYTVEELQKLNIPEEALGNIKIWKEYAEEINKNNPLKKLPLALITLAKILDCESKKEDTMKVLGMKVLSVKKYTLEELQALNIPEVALNNYENWKTYAEEINCKDGIKKLPLSLTTLSSLLGCKKIKNILVKKLGIKLKDYSLKEIRALDLPENVLGNYYSWQAYAKEVNSKNKDNILPISLGGLSALLNCDNNKEARMKALGVESNDYTLEEVQSLDIPEDVLGDDKKWSIFSQQINNQNKEKKLPLSLGGFSRLLICKNSKNDRIKALGIISSTYSLEELQKLNIPEGVLGNIKIWKEYAEEINKNNQLKKLPLTILTLSSLLKCINTKEGIMDTLGISSSTYTLEELQSLKIPEEVLGDNIKWRPFAQKINTQNKIKVLPTSLNGLNSLLACENNKAARIKALEN